MTKQEFIALTSSKITILDGATGSNLQKRGMPTGVSPEAWMLENPQIIVGLQREFLEAGSDILFAPTFTANRIKLGEYGLVDRIEEINRGLAMLSKKAVEEYRNNTGSTRDVYIAADITMTGEQLYPVGTLPFEELVEVYKEQLRYIIPMGVDLVVVETMMSLQECRAALLAIKEVCDLPVIISLTFNENQRTLYGTDPKTAVIVLQSMGADAVGINCSTGPDKMLDIVREMKEYSYVPIMAKPNAGIPRLVEGMTHFPTDAVEFAEQMEQLIDAGANIVGGCCGTTPEHMKLLVDKTLGKSPIPPRSEHIRALTTEQQTVEIPLNGPFMIVGERINPTGKKALQAQLREGKSDMVAQMAAEQAELGAALLDVNVGMNGIDEQEVMLQVMQEALDAAKLPLSIDSSHVSVIEAALRVYPGRALINSISLEKEKFEKLIPIAKKYGAMFILLPLSEQGLPKDIQEKKQIIQTILARAYELGLTREDIIVDGLVTTVGANKNAALETLETIRYCKEELGIATIVGLSNISFGLPERQFINSTFLAFAIQAGLTMAIANPSQDLLVNTSLAADLLRAVEDAPQRYIDRATARPTTITAGTEAMTASGRTVTGNTTGAPSQDCGKAVGVMDSRQVIFQAVVKGNRKNIVDLVKQELTNSTPEELIDQTLIPAINEVGDLYDKSIYFLPQLIASAETMKLAIDYLEPMLKKNEKEASKGTIVIATVAGDIHDIGKNLVALMLKNYGFKVIDLGKDVATQKIIQTAIEEHADIIALSALMTTTMVEMKHVVQKAREQGLTAKVIIGGAVITDDYAQEIGADGYSEDAQSAVALVTRLMNR
ncbi:MAG: homocysteine S-methyltransferase [Herbinix sp.]|jgi:5-methyltetrahydrofolate--homocysteine methyltransferase|nr:homocysteine S-methyltransferase [Herbinix sp.]